MHIKMKKILFAVLVLLSSKSLFAQEAEDVGWIARFGAADGVEKILHQTYEIDLLVIFSQ